jgi:hypothetical protein
MMSLRNLVPWAGLFQLVIGGHLLYGQSPRDLWTGNPRIRAAEFRVLYLRANSFPLNEANLTGNALQVLVRKFQDDIDDFVDNSENDRKMFTNVAVARYSSQGVRNLVEVQDSIGALSSEISGALAKALGHRPVVLIYLLAHGVDVGGGRIELELDAGVRAARDDIRRAARNMPGPRLVVFITDNCSNQITGAGLPLDDLHGGVWRALYFGHQGFVDIRTSGPNQFAFASRAGSVFLHGLNRALSPASLPATAPDIASVNRDDRQAARKAFVEHFDTKDPRTGKGDGVMSWNEFREHLASQVEESVTATRNLLPMGSPIRTLMNAGQAVVIDTREVSVLPPQGP